MKRFIIECKQCGSLNCDIMMTESNEILIYCLNCENDEEA